MRWVLTAALLVAATPVWAQAASNVLTWQDNSTNEASFEIWHKAIPTPAPGTAVNCAGDPNPYSLLATVVTNGTTFTHTGLLEGSTHCYEVRAVNSAGASAFSNQAGRTSPLQIPAPPSALAVTGGP